jgi:hypothetical protein
MVTTLSFAARSFLMAFFMARWLAFFKAIKGVATA